jgi:isopentenyldiphosphate isomerase
MKQLTCRSWGVSNAYKEQKLNELIMDKLLQDRKYEKAMWRTRWENTISSADVHMETLEDAIKQGKESEETWSAQTGRQEEQHTQKVMPKCVEVRM